MRLVAFTALLIVATSCGSGGGGGGGGDGPGPLPGMASMTILTPEAGEIVNDLRPSVAIQLASDGTIEFDLSSLEVTVDGQPADVSAWTRFQFGCSGALDGVADGTHTLGASIKTMGGVDVTAQPVGFERSTAGGVTTVVGILLDPEDDSPIVGATVYLEEDPGNTTTTNSSGRFTLSGAMSGLNLHIAWDPEAIRKTDGEGKEYRYPFYKRPIDVLAGAKTQADPCYLPKIYPLVTFQELADQGIYNCMDDRFYADYTLRNDELDIELTIPMGTFVLTRNGSDPCDTYLAISPVNPQKAPSNMPDTADPGLLITIQPTGLRFYDAPNGNAIRIPISFPNVDQIAPGNDIDLFSVDHNTGMFMKMGEMEADPSNPSRLITTSGGIEGGSWHCPCPPGLGGNGPNGCMSENCGGGSGSGPSGGGPHGCTNPVVSLKTGFMREDLVLPPTVSFDTPYSPRLVYLSETVAPVSVLNIPVTVSVRSALPEAISVEAKIGKLPAGKPVYFETSGYSESSDATQTLAVPVPVQGTTTGTAMADVIVRSHFGAGSAASKTSVPLQLFRGLGSEFGRGWSLADDERLLFSEQEGAGPSLVLARGDGQLLSFRADSIVAPGGPGLTLTMYEPATVSYSTFWENEDPVVIRAATVANLDKTVLDPTYESIEEVASYVVFDTSFRTTKYSFDRGSWGHLLNRGPSRVQNTYWSQSVLRGGHYEGFPRGDDIWFYYGPSGAVWDVGFERYSRLDGLFMAPVDGDYTFKLNSNAYYRVGDEVLNFINSNGEATVSLSAGPHELSVAFGSLLPLEVKGGPWVTYTEIPISALRQTAAKDPRKIIWSHPVDESIVRLLADGSWRRTWPSGAVSCYDENGCLTSRADRRGRTMTYERDAQGRVTAVVLPSGARVEFTHSDGQVTQVDMPGGRAVSLSYTGQDLTSVVMPDGETWRYTYRSNGLLASRTDPVGLTTTHDYDGWGRFKSTTYPDGGVRSVSPASSQVLDTLATTPGTEDMPLSPLPESGAVGSFMAQDGMGYSATRTAKDGDIIDERRDPAGINLIRITTTRRDAETERVVRTTVETAPMSGTPRTLRSRVEYDWAGSPLRPQEIRYFGEGGALAHTVQMTWETGTGRLLTRSDVPSAGAPLTTTYTYDPVGNLLTELRPGASTPTTYEYDAANGYALEKITDPTGRSASFVLDATTKNVKDVVSHHVTTSTVFDDAGFVEQLIPSAGATPVEFTRDAFGRVLSRRAATGGVTSFDRDALGRVRTAFVPGRGQYDISYDVLGRLTDWTDQSGRTWAYTYLADGRTSTLTRPDGVKVTYTYDSAGRLQRTEFTRSGDPTEFVQYAYDDLGRVTQVSSENSTISYARNALGQLTGETTQAAGETYTWNYTYDTLGRRTTSSLTYGGSVVHTLTSAFDARGRLASFTSSAAGQFSYTYDELGRPTRLDYPNGLKVLQTFEAGGRLSKRETLWPDDSVLASDELTFDPVGTPSSWKQYRQGLTVQTATMNFTHDASARLTGWSSTELGENVSYGTLAHDGARQLPGMVYDGGGQLVERADRTLVYDGGGRLVEERAKPGGELLRSYAYNLRGRMVEAHEYTPGTPSAIASTVLTYDALGRRSSGQDGVLVWQEWAQRACIDGSQRVHTLVAEPETGAVCAAESSAGLHFHVLDRSESVIARVSSGVAGDWVRYSPFGEHLDGSPQGTGRVGYLGRSFVAVGEFYDFRRRAYSPSMGRFLQPEPLQARIAATAAHVVNAGVYAAHSPLVLGDKDGLYPELLDDPRVVEAMRRWAAELHMRGQDYNAQQLEAGGDTGFEISCAVVRNRLTGRFDLGSCAPGDAPGLSRPPGSGVWHPELGFLGPRTMGDLVYPLNIGGPVYEHVANIHTHPWTPHFSAQDLNSVRDSGLPLFMVAPDGGLHVLDADGNSWCNVLDEEDKASCCPDK